MLPRKRLYWLTAIMVAVAAIGAARELMDRPVVLSIGAAMGLVVANIVVAVVAAYLVTEHATFPQMRRRHPFLVLGLRPCLFSFVAGLVIFVPFSCVVFFQDLILLTVNYDYVEVYEAGSDEGPDARAFRVEPVPKDLQVRLNVVIATGSPYRFRICPIGEAASATVPYRFELFHSAEGRLASAELSYRTDSHWALEYGRDCLARFPELRAPVESRDRYCLDLHYDDVTGERSERTCWDFVRERGADEILVSEILSGARQRP